MGDQRGNEQSGRGARKQQSGLVGGMADMALTMARQALNERRWADALEFARTAAAQSPGPAGELVGRCSARLARAAAVRGDFGQASRHAEEAVRHRPGNGADQERLSLIRRAQEMVREEGDQPLFRDTVGPSEGRWWDGDLLQHVRGTEGGTGTVRRPQILAEAKRGVLADLYAVGPYHPWHDPAPDQLFTRYLRALKAGGSTIRYASILLRQGLVGETKWIEDVDVIVPMATSMRSYDVREFELTEELARDLSKRLCIPFVDAFEVAPDASRTRWAGGYAERAKHLVQSLHLKTHRSARLTEAGTVLVVDDVITYGATFEACARTLRAAFGDLTVYGAALAYTETAHRRDHAAAEQAGLALEAALDATSA